MREKAKVKMQMINANIYLDKLELEIMRLMREDINDSKIPVYIGEREHIRQHLYDLSREIYGKDE